MEYKFSEIEQKWQAWWEAHQTYAVSNKSEKPKYYVLDMFPYPSGAGLHVGHPLGYIASDIYSRYKRLQGFNVLHPMGFDAYGLPAEQYAIQTGTHPEVTTAKNIARYREQLSKLTDEFRDFRRKSEDDMDALKRTQARQGRMIEAMRPFMCGDLKCPNRQRVTTLDAEALERTIHINEQKDIDPYNED